MNSILFLVLLTISSIVTGLITEVWKKLTSHFPTNLSALIIGLIVGGGTGVLYMYFNEIAFTTQNIISLVLLGFASGFAATLGYDKVAQAVKQIQQALAYKEKK